MSTHPIPILMYHQIDRAPAKGSPLRGLVVSPFTFFTHMACLWACGYAGLSMRELEPYLRGEKQGRVVGITFDDGYENNLRFALPVLQRFGFTSTCFVVAGLVGRTNVWDAERGVAQVPLMTVPELQAWVDAGQEIGSHTVTHADLGLLPEPELWSEVEQAKTELESMVAQPEGVRHFCYPYGSYKASSVQFVKKCGYATAVTTNRGRFVIAAGDSLLELPRVLVSRTTTWIHLLVKCMTRYEDKRGVASPQGTKAY